MAPRGAAGKLIPWPRRRQDNRIVFGSLPLSAAPRRSPARKGAQGAKDAGVQKLEDEAFGPPQRPDEIDPFDEAPTEFLLSPTGAAPQDGAEAARGGRHPNITDLQEAPPAEPVTGVSEAPPTDPDAGSAALFNADEELSPAPD